MVPPLIVLKAHLKVVDAVKDRLIPVEDFTSVKKTGLRKGELLIEIQIPHRLKSSAFLKLGRRVGRDISIVSVAISITIKGDLCKDTRIAFGSVSPTPLRARNAEGFLRGKRLDDKVLNEASDIVVEEINPNSTIRASAEYRREALKALFLNAVKTAIARWRYEQHGQD
jgi:carbon-monoxide dehydrogenase medium subunit